MDEILKKKLNAIKLLILDVDGVLTNGWLIYGLNHLDLRCFNSQDGTGIRLLKAVGIETVLVTIMPSDAVKRRAHEMGTDLHIVNPKIKVLDRIIEKYQVSLTEVCYVGDDVVDLEIMELVGLPVAVANATTPVKAVAGYTTLNRGGEGAVREVTDMILEARSLSREV